MFQRCIQSDSRHVSQLDLENKQICLEELHVTLNPGQILWDLVLTPAQHHFDWLWALMCFFFIHENIGRSDAFSHMGLVYHILISLMGAK